MNCQDYCKNCVTFIFLVLLSALTLCVTSATAQQTGAANASTIQKAPGDLDFERATVGQIPVGWESPTQGRGYTAETIDRIPRTGARAALLRSDPDAKIDPRVYGNLMQAVDAAPFRGRRVRLRGAVRVEADEPQARAQLWMRVDRESKQPGFFDLMADRPITSKEWQFYEIVGDVEEDAKILNFGIILSGRGKAYLDDVTVEDLGKPIVLAEAPRPLTKRGLENVIAFTKLLGYVRHFHPSDEAARTDWDAFAVNGLREVEGARDAAELLQKLKTLFAPVAPTVNLYKTGALLPSTVNVNLAGDQPLKIVFWEHRGFGNKTSRSAGYESERTYEDFSQLNGATKTDDSRPPYVGDLGGGVSCVVPLVVFADSGGTLPKNASPGSSPSASLVKYNGNDRVTRIADVALAWNVLQHFYPYFDVVKTDWAAALKKALVSAAIDADEKAFVRTLRLMVAELHDGHGSVRHQSRTVVEALPLIFRWVENRLVVTNVAEGIEAVQPGDVVLSIDGVPSAQAIRAGEALISSATPQYRRYLAVDLLRAGYEKNSEAKLEIEGADGKTRVAVVRRTAQAAALRETRPAKIEEIKSGIFYIDIDRITDEDFQNALPKLEKAKGIIFDVRGYPKSSALMMAYLFDKPFTSPQFLFPYITRPNGQEVDYEINKPTNRGTVEPKSPYLTAKKVFITDGRAISAAETFMGIVENYKLGEIVGETTAGTNGNANQFALPGNYAIRFTGMKVLKHDGTRHHGIGIRPTIPVSRTIKGIREKRDEQLEKAITVVSN